MTLVLWPFVGPVSLLAMLGAHVILVWATLVPASRLLGPVVRRFRSDQKEVWLTIDDGPDPDDTPKVLDLLDAYGARATFFVKGERADAHPNLLREIVERGHSVGNHSWSHPSGTFWCLPPRAIGEQIRRANDAIERILGDRPVLFRAPVGMKNPFVHPVLAAERMVLVAWSARAWDTVSKSPEQVGRRIVGKVAPGAIVLVHEGDLVSGLRGSEMVDAVVGCLSREGYRCVIPEMDRLV